MQSPRGKLAWIPAITSVNGITVIIWLFFRDAINDQWRSAVGVLWWFQLRNMTSSNYYSVIILIFQLFIPYDEFQLRFHTTAMDRNSVEGVNESSRYSRLMTAKASYSWQNQTVEKENSQRLDFCEDERNLNRHMLWNWSLSEKSPTMRRSIVSFRSARCQVPGQPGARCQCQVSARPAKQKSTILCRNRPSWFKILERTQCPEKNQWFCEIIINWKMTTLSMFCRGTTMVETNDQGRTITLTK